MYNKYINHVCHRKAIDVPLNKPKDHESFEKYIINNTAYIIWQCSAPGVSNNV